MCEILCDKRLTLLIVGLIAEQLAKFIRGTFWRSLYKRIFEMNARCIYKTLNINNPMKLGVRNDNGKLKRATLRDNKARHEQNTKSLHTSVDTRTSRGTTTAKAIV